jgi:cytochrome c oxidase assembly factor CtaG
VDSELAPFALFQLIAIAWLAQPLAAGAHLAGDDPSGAAWNLEAWLAVLLVTSAWLYASGVRALWRKAGRGRGIRRIEVARFAVGWVAMAVALLSPIDTLGSRAFSVHMLQHELLMVVAAPLLVLGRPLQAWVWALPMSALRALAAVANARGLHRAWRWITGPFGAWCFHAVALWLWHVPALFEAALASPGIHVLQHASFFASALAFWWAVFGRGVLAPDGISVASLFTTMLHTSALGALLTFAPSVWYGSYAMGNAFGLTPLEDQQLGGLLMWVPAGFAYVAAGLWIAGKFLADENPDRTKISVSDA